MSTTEISGGRPPLYCYDGGFGMCTAEVTGRALWHVFSTSLPGWWHFTGKERDQETGLDYFGARYYGSALGRFTSPDPKGTEIRDSHHNSRISATPRLPMPLPRRCPGCLASPHRPLRIGFAKSSILLTGPVAARGRRASETEFASGLGTSLGFEAGVFENTMLEVYLLWFVTEQQEQDDDGILIGVYDSHLSAEAAINRLRTRPGFRDYPQGFHIHPRQVGQDSWTEGFVLD